MKRTSAIEADITAQLDRLEHLRGSLDTPPGLKWTAQPGVFYSTTYRCPDCGGRYVRRQAASFVCINGRCGLPLEDWIPA